MNKFHTKGHEWYAFYNQKGNSGNFGDLVIWITMDYISNDWMEQVIFL